MRVRIVNPDILDQASSMTRLLAVKYKEPANCLRPQKFEVGYLAGASTKELLREKEISEGALLRFLNEPAAFVLCRYQQNHREDVNRYAFARRLACLDSVTIVTSSTQAASQFKLVIDHLVKQQHLEGRSCDELIQQYAEFVDSVVRPNFTSIERVTSTNSASMFLQQHVAKSGSFPRL